MKTRSELVFVLVAVAVDLAAVVLALLLAGRLAAGTTSQFAPFAPLWIIVFALLGLYDLRSSRGRGDEIRLVITGAVCGLLSAITAEFFLDSSAINSRQEALYALPLTMILVVAGRLLVVHIQRRLLLRGIGVHHAVIIGSGPAAQALLTTIGARESGFSVVASVDGHSDNVGVSPILREDIPAFPSLDAVFQAGLPVDDVFQADAHLADSDADRLVAVAAERNVTYRYTPGRFQLQMAHSALETIGGSPLVLVRRSPLDGWNRIIKRAFDVVVGGSMILVLTPLFALLALLVKSGDKGPVIYSHRRLARNGREISVFKFRTMKAHMSSGPGFSGMSDIEIFRSLGRPELADSFRHDQKLRDDPRVTRIGKTLRRSSLDELPQLFNVLKGDLSLVGPRPIVDDELERYGAEAWTLLSAKPGLTGLWQVSGRNDLSYDERVRLDMFYVENWSLWLDVRIFFRTILMVLRRSGAY